MQFGAVHDYNPAISHHRAAASWQLQQLLRQLCLSFELRLEL